jgi:hypothetical protein
MLDNRPILRERLLAAATFVAIGFGTLAALDFIVTGGFDYGARRTSSSYGSPLIGANAGIAAEPAPSTVTTVVWTDPLAAEEAAADDLADAAETPAPDEAQTALSEDQLYRDIEQLYLGEETSAAEDETVATSGDESALHGGDDSAQTLYDARDLMPDPNAPDSEP